MAVKTSKVKITRYPGGWRNPQYGGTIARYPTGWKYPPKGPSLGV